ncbi:unnamed protein product [Lupinus luteus]|uniref:Homer protein n=1 Tax=Lupinus luteus TaxID=3873 RepID=A0AAV1XVZ8_LUPLU
MAKGRKFISSPSERFFGTTFTQSSTLTDSSSEFREEDIWSTAQERDGWEPRRRHVGGLSLTFEDQGKSDNGSVIMHHHHHHHNHKYKRHDMATSAPVNVPDWSKILRVESVESLHGMDDGVEEDDSVMVPPHEYLARKKAANSVFEGVGRTLKGRDLSRVRDAVWSQTGAIEEEVNVVAEISAELERERQKNAELLNKISMLQAQIRERDMETQENHLHVVESSKKCKRQKTEMVADEVENLNADNTVMASHYKSDSESIVPKEISPEKPLISWMSMDDSQNNYHEKVKDSDFIADFNETDSDGNACEENYDDDLENAHTHEVIDDITETVNAQKVHPHIAEESNVTCMQSFSDPAGNVRQEDHEIQKASCILHAQLSKKSEIIKTYEVKSLDAPSESLHVSQNRKPPKVAFCPKEIRRIIESEALLQKNAQSHTIRKIIVFGSLGIRHGCEEMYELDFNHFSIMNKGEPYVSPRNPGEHVLYENPGVKRKLFYPQLQNPVLCPVNILEEERAMRPSDASCPSCLFLCIKYGGRTRNLPQNEYVRQRMGRNKLKTFGPLMCRMAMLVHIRSGSFFFKALGIALLFMAGFPGDLVNRETKYRNLDLLQKYYRTDEDAEGEELFLPQIIACDNGTDEPKNLTKKIVSTKPKGRKHSNEISKCHNSKNSPSQQSKPTSSASAATQFGLTGYSTGHSYANTMAAFHSMTSQISPNTYHGLHSMLPPQPASSFVPILYWPPPNAFVPGPYPSTNGYQSFPNTPNYMSFQTQPYYNYPACISSVPKLVEGSGKNDLATDESDSHSDSS